MTRLRRTRLDRPGLTRRRRGRGFQLLGPQGERVDDAETIERVAALVIPPAWTDVWISPDPLGHIQAVGTDAAGRRQYRYHDAWHEQQARRKFDEMVVFAQALPDLRKQVAADLARTEADKPRALAGMVRLLDVGFFRIGCEDYAERNGTYGLATMRKDHVVIDGEALVFDFAAKSGRRRVQHVVDADVAALVQTLRRRRGGGEELFAYKEGRRWHDVKSAHVNAYLKDRTGLDVSAKDFRTWGATVMCAVALGVAEVAPQKRRSPSSVKRVQAHAIKEVSRYLGNTPAVCRRSYVDPRVLDRHATGETIGRALRELGEQPEGAAVSPVIERAVLRLLLG